jgi:MarC family membrane protein
MSTLSATLLLFLVMDPLGNIPVFLCVLKDTNPKRHKKIILRELCIALGILITFLFTGQYILMLMQVSRQSLSIAGGVIIFLIAIKMIFSGTEEIFVTGTKGEPLIVPLAIPLVAGPSSMTTVMLLIAKEPERWMDWLIALICAWFMSGIILVFSGQLRNILRKRGLIALERLMGMLLTTVAVEMFITGIRESFLK